MFNPFYAFRASIALAALSFVGCGLDGNQSDANRARDHRVAIAGVVAKGYVSQTTVTPYRMTATGREPIGESVRTDTLGRFTLHVPGSVSFPILIEAVGGTYLDEATGFVVTLSTPLRLKIDAASNDRVFAVTPLTEISARLSQNDSRSVIDTNRSLARRLSGQGIESIDVATVVPVSAAEPPSAGSSNTQVSYGLLLAMISQYANDRHSGDLGSALNVMAADFADGIFDLTHNELANALSAFQASSRNKSGNAASPLVAIIREHGNNAPVASDGSVTVGYQASVTVNLIATDANGDALMFSVTAPSKGDLSPNGASFTYTARAGQSGADSFTFRANDGVSDSNMATISINIGLPNNTPPVANNGSLSVGYNTATTGTLSASDADNNPLTYSIVTNGTKGTAVITNASTGAYTYTPQSGQTGADSFSFRVNDGAQNSLAATIDVVINGPNNTAPVANNGSLSVLWNTVTAGTLSASDSDGDPLIFSLANQPSFGSVSLGTNGQYTYTPGTATGTTSFTYRVNDGTVDSNIATVTLSIQGGDPANGGTLFNNNCLSCHTIASRQGRSVTQIKDAIRTVPSMNSRSNLQALTDGQLGDIAARLAQ